MVMAVLLVSFQDESLVNPLGTMRPYSTQRNHIKIIYRQPGFAEYALNGLRRKSPLILDPR
jgi:hypothetical protein